MSLTACEFQGTVRFRPVDTLGRGVMGVVYRVWDAELGCEVALKTVRDLWPEEIYWPLCFPGQTFDIPVPVR